MAYEKASLGNSRKVGFGVGTRESGEFGWAWSWRLEVGLGLKLASLELAS